LGEASALLLSLSLGSKINISQFIKPGTQSYCFRPVQNPFLAGPPFCISH